MRVVREAVLKDFSKHFDAITTGQSQASCSYNATGRDRVENPDAWPLGNQCFFVLNSESGVWTNVLHISMQ